MGTQGNDLGHGKNVEDWAIRRAGPKPAMVGHGPLSETAKASVIYDGLTTLRLLKVQSGLIGDYREKSNHKGWIGIFQLGCLTDMELIKNKTHFLVCSIYKEDFIQKLDIFIIT
jgi:hypothetical protein